MRFMVMILFFVFTLSAFADSEIFLAKINSAPTKTIYDLSVLVDDSDRLLEGRLVAPNDGTVFTINDLLEGTVVLSRRDGRDILKLQQLTGFDESDGGPLKLIYLYNGVLGSYKNILISIIRDNEGQWILADQKHKRIESMKLVSKKVLGQLVGIERIEITYAP